MTARKRRRTPAPLLPPRSEPVYEPWTPEELSLGDALYEHTCPESIVDRRNHANGVARMILNRRDR